MAMICNQPPLLVDMAGSLCVLAMVLLLHFIILDVVK